MTQEYTAALSSAKLINAILLKPLPLSATDILRIEANASHLKSVVANGLVGDMLPINTAIAAATAAILAHDKTGSAAEIAALVSADLVTERDAAVAAVAKSKVDSDALVKAAQDALAASEAKVAQLQAQIDAYTPPAPIAPPATVAVISMRQARLVLNNAGLLQQVEAAVAAADVSTQIEWEYAVELRRDWPTLTAMAAALGLTDVQLDDLFVQAATL